MALYYFESKITHTFSMEQDLNEGVLIDFRLFLIWKFSKFKMKMGWLRSPVGRGAQPLLATPWLRHYPSPIRAKYYFQPCTIPCHQNREKIVD